MSAPRRAGPQLIHPVREFNGLSTVCSWYKPLEAPAHHDFTLCTYCIGVDSKVDSESVDGSLPCVPKPVKAPAPASTHEVSGVEIPRVILPPLKFSSLPSLSQRESFVPTKCLVLKKSPG